MDSQRFDNFARELVAGATRRRFLGALAGALGVGLFRPFRRPQDVAAQSGDCWADEMDCAGICVSVGSDPLNCGACGQACAPGQTCQGGICACGYLPNQRSCAGRCVDTTSDDLHCGWCWHACDSGQTRTRASPRLRSPDSSATTARRTATPWPGRPTIGL